MASHESMSKFEWKNHQTKYNDLFTMMQEGYFTDCHLFADGISIACHRNVLSASSDFFKQAFGLHFNREPVIIMNSNVTASILSALVEFMYTGSCEFPSNKSHYLIGAAQALAIKGFEPDAMTFTKGQRPSTVEARDLLMQMLNEEVVEKLPAQPSRHKSVYCSSSTRASVSRPVPIRKRRASEGTGTRGAPAVGKKPFPCDFCGKHYVSDRNCEKHRLECMKNPLRSSVECPICSEDLKPSEKARHMKKHSKHA